jgi:hypothetical protein
MGESVVTQGSNTLLTVFREEELNHGDLYRRTNK